jgi:tRNA dimethylallyltransferase
LKGALKMFVIIGGATGTGKSQIAIELAKLIGGEVVSADSMQVYRGMDIGTYKTPVKDRQGVTHHMIDVAGPGDNFSAAMYKEMAEAVMDDIKKRGRVPVLAGGTGLYISAVINGIMKAKEPDDSVKEQLRAELDEKGVDLLGKRLEQLDPEAAKTTDLKNGRRVVRALGLITANGMKLSELRKTAASTAYKDKYVLFSAALSRDKLYKSLDLRVDEMVKMGLSDEVRRLMESPGALSPTALQAIGYKEMADYLERRCSLKVAADNIKQATRNYAKRQVTWFKKYSGAIALDMEKMTPPEAAAYIKTIISDFRY